MKNHLLLATGLMAVAAPAWAQPVPPPAAAVAPAPVPTPATPATAGPDVQQNVSNALAEYQQKHYGKAAEELEEAAAQLRGLKADALAQFLPEPPKGWTARNEQNILLKAHIAGMGSQAERTYISGDEKVKVAITTDSKLAGAMHRLASSTPAMQFMGYDYVFKTPDPNTAAFLKDNVATLFISDTFTIAVSGEKLTDQQAQGFMGLIDLAKLKVEAEK